MYRILLDQNKTFECDIQIEGASVSNTSARLVLETDNFSISFKGEIKDGKVKIPINKLKGILTEHYKGQISLEVIAEDTFFVPWKDSYETDTHRKVEVKFNNSTVITENTKPKVTVINSTPPPVVLTENDIHANNILDIIKRKNNIKDVYKKHSLITEAMGVYCVSKGLDVKKDIKKIESIFNILVKKIIHP